MIMQPAGGFHADGEGVLVTGCSSGIGRAIAIELSQHGFSALATVRKESDAEALRNLHEPNLIPICPLDLAKVDQIASTVETVADVLEQRGQKGL